MGDVIYHAIQDLKFTSAFRWHEPEPLLSSFGANWDYQPHPTLLDTLANESLRKARRNSRDKRDNPFFLVSGGAGTGKSKLLNRFRELLIKSLENVASDTTLNASDTTLATDLLKRLSTAYVFKLTFENGTRVILSANDPSKAKFDIGCRMLYQLREDRQVAFQSFSQDPAHHVLPCQVLELLSKSEGKPLEDMTVIILVDGVQALDHTLGSKSSALKRARDSLSALSIASSAFVLPVMAATIFTPLRDIFPPYEQKHLFLPLSVLEPTEQMFPSFADPVVRAVADDAGGHPRTLELVADIFANRDVKDIHLSQLYNDVLASLRKNYPGIQTVFSLPLLAAILTSRPVTLSDTFPVASGSMTVATLIETNLFWRTEVPGFPEDAAPLQCGFFLLMLLAQSREAIKQHFLGRFRLEAQNIGPSDSAEIAHWQHWEDFLATHRVLRSIAFREQSVPVQQFHNGACFSSKGCDFQLQVHEQTLKQCYRQTKTKSSAKSKIIGAEDGDYAFPDDQYVFANRYGASASDSFCSVTTVENERFNEVHQAKRYKADITKDIFESERQKAADENDFFILFSTGKTSVAREDLPDRSALVDHSRFKAYFGPFAGRAFYALNPPSLNINTATRAQLESVSGIGHAIANAIMKNRKDTAITSLDQLKQIPGIADKAARELAPFFGINIEK